MKKYTKSWFQKNRPELQKEYTKKVKLAKMMGFSDKDAREITRSAFRKNN